MEKTLLLWDIDGTLIDSGGAGDRALRVSLLSLFGIEDTFHWLNYAGRTDRWIARTILEHHGLPGNPAGIDRFLEGYLTAVAREVHNPHARSLPGIEAILSSTAKMDTLAHGLLTGNLRRGAEIKLGHLGLWRHFPFGAFADDAEQRDDLGPFALRRASAHCNHGHDRRRVYVIGDTPHDIACGRAIGVQTIAVATGRYSLADLSKCQPTFALESLADARGFLELIS